MNTFKILKRLCANEKEAFTLLEQYAPNTFIDPLGSVVGFIGERGNGKPTILLDAHIDRVGLIVTHTGSDGFVKVEPVGGIDRRALAAQAVIFHSREPVHGVICTLPPHVKKSDKTIKADDIWVDTGNAAVRQGDYATIDHRLTRLHGDVVTGVALDNRAGICSILFALELLRSNRRGEDGAPYNIAVSFSVQEELGQRGAAVTAYNADPDYAVVVDVSYADKGKGKLGGGTMIGYSPILDRDMFETLKELDENHQIEIMNGDTGTNADTVASSKGGVKTALLSIPLRYMHTPAETVDLTDIEATGKLIAAFIEKGVNNS
jgi:endoglucanase